MEMASLRNAPNPGSIYEPLDQVTKPNISTEKAAYYLDRKPGTLNKWAQLGKGPVRPIRVNGRLAWPVAEIKRVLGVSK